ncbi:MAG: pseudouridine-5'-phosphate glycosidase [Anaerolineae bacterium]|nr:pseudouridine-5'-phosphate glycosidase [Anaerolineae bacterium]
MQTVTLNDEVRVALAAGRPVVALESTVISHGLPFPQNLTLAQDLEQTIRSAGATPATIAVIGGELRAGLDADALQLLANGQEPVLKLSRRDLPGALARGSHGATTVAATMLIAHWAGIEVFSTGGIGGVHRGTAGDISADLLELSQTPVLVVCAGAKAILDIPRTLEWLETFGVPVVGYGTADFPAFYSASSGQPVSERLDSPEAVAALWRAEETLGLKAGLLVTVPIPSEAAIPTADIEGVIQQALQQAEAQGISGKALTPFLLNEVSVLSAGRSLAANLALLRNNAAVAASIARALASSTG